MVEVFSEEGRVIAQSMEAGTAACNPFQELHSHSLPMSKKPSIPPESADGSRLVWERRNIDLSIDWPPQLIVYARQLRVQIASATPVGYQKSSVWRIPKLID